MHADITITDPDRKLDFTLSLEYSYRGFVRPRCGWNDGGEPGEPSAIEIDQARCLEVVVWCGQRGVSAIPGLAADECLEPNLRAWCLANYADEIEQALWEQLQPRLESGLCSRRTGRPVGHRGDERQSYKVKKLQS